MLSCTKLTFAQMQLLPLQNNSAFGAMFPCIGEKKSVNSGTGVSNALQCRVDNGSSVCIFITAEQQLDVQSFNKNGWDFIREVNNQYALGMDKNFKSVYGKLLDKGGLGKVYAYELTRYQDGMQINVKGMWLVSGAKMLRGAVSCAPVKTNYMKNEIDIFFNSFSIIR